MKLKKTIFAAIIALSISEVQAASSIQYEIGEMKDATGVTVTTGVWMLVLNTSGVDSSLPGGITTGSSDSITGSLVDKQAASDDFRGLTLNLEEPRSINGDRIMIIGTIGDEDFGDGYAVGSFEFADGQENKAYAIYWFPGLSLGDQVPATGSFEVGGVFTADTSTFAPRGMFSPPNPEAFESAVFDVNSINAVLIPEPSAITLTGLVALALLRRRRA